MIEINFNFLPMIQIFSAISIIYGILTDDFKFMLLGVYIVLMIIVGIMLDICDLIKVTLATVNKETEE